MLSHLLFKSSEGQTNNIFKMSQLETSNKEQPGDHKLMAIVLML